MSGFATVAMRPARNLRRLQVLLVRAWNLDYLLSMAWGLIANAKPADNVPESIWNECAEEWRRMYLEGRH